VTLRLRLATRGSPLAIAQATSIARRLGAIGVVAELVVIATEGDVRLDVALSELAGRGVFTKEIQSAVLAGRADVAVHSAKDLPATTPDGLVLASVPERADPADGLVGRPLGVLAPGATVATGAPRRRALLLSERPDLNVVGVRGNVATRLEAVASGRVDALVVAVAALERLGLADQIAERLDPQHFVPQVGQGALALECVPDSDAHDALRAIDDPTAHESLRAERSYLDALGAGCELPGGAHAIVGPDDVTVRGVLMTEDGTHVVRGVVVDVDPARAGRALAEQLRNSLERATQ
jgi:hydroxymethylbilane synthase